MKELNEFEKEKCKKKPNRYAKAHLEQHISLDETMGTRIRQRNQLTQAKIESNMLKSQYSHKRLAKSFKSYKSEMLRTEIKKESTSSHDEYAIVRETGTSRITPLGLEIPKN